MAFDGAPARLGRSRPTNTGKTHPPIERMLAHRTGMIGLPLRLLAREVYDRSSRCAARAVALVTGEERIVPPRAAYWVCTVEAMPVDIGADFLAVDEIQLAATPTAATSSPTACCTRAARTRPVPGRRHHARRASRAWCPAPQLIQPRRLSEPQLRRPAQAQPLPPRTAVVAFSAEDVYAIAERMRRQRGGAAVVMGALSPAHAQRAGRAVPGRRGRLPGRHRRHRHGPEPRRRPRRLRRPRQVRRPPPPAPRRRASWPRSPAAPGATPPTAPSASPARRRRSTPSSSRRSRTTASAPLRAPALAQPALDFATPEALLASLEAPAASPTCSAPARPTTSRR